MRWAVLIGCVAALSLAIWGLSTLEHGGWFAFTWGCIVVLAVQIGAIFGMWDKR